MAGAMVAILARGDGGLSRLRRPAAWTLGVSAVLLAAIVTWRGTLEGDDNVIFVAGVPLMALVYAGLMVTALTAPAGTRLHDVLVNRSLRNWGRYSYGIYVFHYPIVGAAGMKLGFVIAGTAGLIGSRLPGVALLGALAAAVSYGMALASYHLYEKPFLQLKRYFVTSGRPEPC
jgi:peptidoglycan/LPS O-acetylase OafA/YrhL